MATLFRALKTRDELKAVVSKNNWIGDEAARHLGQMLSEQVPASPLNAHVQLASLHELALINNKHTPTALHQLLI